MNALLSLALLLPASGVEVVETATILVLDLDATDAGRAGTARLVRDQVAAELARRAGYVVITSDDVERIAGVEAGRQAAGCDEDESCLVELAGAVGAGTLVYGSVGALGTTEIVNLTVLDAVTGRPVDRINIRADDAGELPARIDAALRKVFGPVETPRAIARSAPTARTSSVVALSLAGVGAAVAVAGGALAVVNHANLENPQGIGKDASLRFGTLGLVMVGLGAVTASGGAVLLLLGVE